VRERVGNARVSEDLGFLTFWGDTTQAQKKRFFAFIFLNFTAGMTKTNTYDT
jgi:hypothetical protein